MASNLRRRYPGINSFTKNDEDIFCGRKEDVKNLLTRLMIGNTLVMYGESGNGKSSLVQAGLLPELGRYSKMLESKSKLPYRAVTIRMDEINKEDKKGKQNANVNLIVEYILNILRADLPVDKIKLPLLKDHPDHLWYYAKQVEKKGYSLLLVFDQFEELQSFSEDQIKLFSGQLADLFVNRVPERLYEEYSAATKEINLDNITEETRREFSENIRFLEQYLNTRLLFVIREDKLGTMSKLRDNFPDILKNDYILDQLNEKNAREAIGGPCKKKGDFVSEPFTIEETAQDKLIEILRNKTNKKGFFDPFELQVVCGAIEKKVIKTKKTSIRETDLPKVENAIRDFYDRIWDLTKENQKLGKKELMQIKRKMISALVINRKRNMVLEDSLANNKTEKSVLKELIQEGLIKGIPAGNQHFYQLRHDRLIIPLIEDMQDLEAAEKVQKEIQAQIEAEEMKYKIRVEAEKVRYEKRRASDREEYSRKFVMIVIGSIGVCLPFLVVIGNFIYSGSMQVQNSISNYYGQGTGSDIFVGMLFALAFSLVSYKGYEKSDSISAKLGAFFALGVAMCPVGSRSSLVNNLHFIFAMLLFSVFVFFSIYLFRKSAGHPTKQKKMRNQAYLVCGILMLVCIVVIAASGFLLPPELVAKYHLVFYMESIMFVSFGYSWLIKGGLILKDRG